MSRCAIAPAVRVAVALGVSLALVLSTGAAGASESTNNSMRGWVPPSNAVDGTGERTSPGTSQVDGEVIVKFKASALGTASVSAAHASVGATTICALAAVPGLELVRVGPGVSVGEAVKAYEAMAAVEYAQPNYIVSAIAWSRNDPLFSQQWGLYNTIMQNNVAVDADIDAPEAWDVPVPSQDVLVAVLDTGVDYVHPDLAANIWVNSDEIAGNGVDDDHNGFADDVRGYDFWNGDSDPMDDHGHGTHCAGTIGAVASNGVGISGIAPNISLLAVKVASSEGYLTSASVIQGIQYASAAGAQICNCSWGSGDWNDPAVTDAMAAADMLFVCAAGNGGVNTDTTPYYPACYDLPNVISVGSHTDSGRISDFSNYGASTVDVFAPGDGIVSTIRAARSWSLVSGATATTIWSNDFHSSTDYAQWATTSNCFLGWEYVGEQPLYARCQYADNEQAFLDQKTPLNLAGAASVWLRFKMGHSLEPGHDWFLVGVYDASAGANGYHTLAAYTGVTPNPWSSCTVDLSAFAGQTDIYLWYGVISDSSVSYAEGYRGAWVDDVEVLKVQATSTTLRSDVFGSLSAWTAESPWTRSTTVGHSAAGSACVAGYGDGVDSALTMTNPIDLTHSSATLSFSALYDLEDAHDYLDVYAIVGSEWKLLASYTGLSGGGSSETWENETISLDEVAGNSSVKIAFNLYSDDANSAAQGYSGAWIDDLAVRTTPWAPATNYTWSYNTWSGTSMAAPHVSGVAALALNHVPELTATELKAAIIDGAELKTTYSGKCVSGGRANALGAMAARNNAPVAAADSYRTLARPGLGVEGPGVLANDVDPDGDRLSAEVVSQPAHGFVWMTWTGGFQYTPTAGFTGTDSFTYSVTDNFGASATGNVTVTVVDGERVEDTPYGITFDRFVPCESTAYSASTYTYGRWSGTRFELRFTGDRIVWIGPKQPSYGMADVYIDGVKMATVDCYAPAESAALSAEVWDSGTLTPGSHVLSIRLTGAKNAASTGNVVAIDHFETYGLNAGTDGVRWSEYSGTFSGSWVNCASSSYEMGWYRYSRWAGARYSFTFTGKRIAWIGPRASNYGRADVYIDGVKKATVSQYGALGWRYRVWESGTLPQGTHTIEIRVLGTKDAASTGTIVVVDAFDVN